MKTNWKLQRQEKAKRKALRKKQNKERFTDLLPVMYSHPKPVSGNAHQRRVARRFLVHGGKPQEQKENESLK